MNNYIKLNNNNNHLSLGNLFNIIKNHSKNKSSAIQVEIFCLLFNIESISETTVNNYCTGYRSIGSDYKQIYLNYQKKYQKDFTVLLEPINNILSIIDGHINNYHTIDEINESISLKKLTTDLHILAKNDIYVPNKTKKDILKHLNNHNYYLALSQILFFIVLDKKQPLYEQDLIKETIEEILTNTNISVNDLKKYLHIQFKEGISLIPSLKKLAKENNSYALYELGNLEYNGQIAGYPRYEESYKYHQQASTYDNPSSYWMLAHMIITKKIGSLSDDDIDLAWTYLEKAKSLNSISALNTIGICHLYGYTKNKTKDLNLAISYFKKAAESNYIYAYNNLGKIYEEKKEYQKAFSYYKLSADNEESWACNKLGEFYRQGIYVDKNLELAFHYYSIGANAQVTNRSPWNIYNLVKYFYLKGSAKLGIKKDLDKSIKLLEENHNHEPSKELLLYTYYEKYLTTKDESDLHNLKHYLTKINLSNIPIEKKKEIDYTLSNIYNYQINIKL